MGRRALLLAATMTVAGCFGTGHRSNPFTEGGVGTGTIRVIAQNHNFHQATLKALGRAQHRIGIVSGNRREVFTLDWPTVDNLIIEIDLLAGGTFRTNSISLEPGETATLYIQQALGLSTLVRGGRSEPEPIVNSKKRYVK